jgi:hypothetical protein
VLAALVAAAVALLSRSAGISACAVGNWAAAHPLLLIDGIVDRQGGYHGFAVECKG